MELYVKIANLIQFDTILMQIKSWNVKNSSPCESQRPAYVAERRPTERSESSSFFAEWNVAKKRRRVATILRLFSQKI